MFLSDWRGFPNRRSRTPRPARGRRRTCPLRAEELEGRWVPATFFFNTGAPDGLIGTASRPAAASNGNVEFESADDFVLTSETQIDQVTFTGLVPSRLALPSGISDINIEIYRVFPKDSVVTRTSGPPTFSTSQVPTRVNSPSDVEFASEDNQTATTNVLNPSFTVMQSIDNPANIKLGGGGSGPVTGQEVQFTVTLSSSFILPADHYFFVPQVLLSSGDFLWLSAPKPITGAGTTPFTPDLQSWMRDDPPLAPDWLRIGQDIIGNNTAPFPTFNASFSLTGETVTPQLTSLSPASVVEGTPGLTLTLNGSAFTQGSTVLLNGNPLTTTFVSNGQLSVTLPASVLAEEGAPSFAISDSGVTSNGLTLTVTEGAATGTASVTKFTLVGRGANATIAGSFLDQASEDHVVRIDWGDGTQTTLDEGAGAGGSFTASHHFKRAPKHKSATVQVLDEGSPVFQTSVALVAPKHHKKGH